MEDLYYVPSFRAADVFLRQCGFQAPDARHSQGPLCKDAHILQYVSSGRGYLRIRGREFCVGAGDLFYLPKNVLLSYRAEPADPYVYYWVGIDGVEAKKLIARVGLDENSPVKHFGDERLTAALRDICLRLAAKNYAGEVGAYAALYDLCALLLSFSAVNCLRLNDAVNEYVAKSAHFIAENFGDNINVTKIAAAVGLSRNYFSMIFHEAVGMTPVDYLMRYRIEQAEKMLSEGMSVTETALSCGFNSPANFTVQFKKITGKIPRNCKRPEHNIVF